MIPWRDTVFLHKLTRLNAKSLNFKSLSTQQGQIDNGASQNNDSLEYSVKYNKA